MELYHKYKRQFLKLVPLQFIWYTGSTVFFFYWIFAKDILTAMNPLQVHIKTHCKKQQLIIHLYFPRFSQLTLLLLFYM